MKIGRATVALALTFGLSWSALAQTSTAYNAKLKDAEAGQRAAMISVAQMHATKGADAPYDLGQAYKWYSLAAKCEADTEKKQELLRIINKMSIEMNASQTRAGELGAAGWKGKCQP